MFFHKESKQAFVFPPRCGTRSTMEFLKKCEWKNIGKNHFVPEKFIEHYPNLTNYQIYAFFRDPVLRFESKLLYIKQVTGYKEKLEELLVAQGISKTREEVSYDELVDIFPVINQTFYFLFDPQDKWYKVPNITGLDFSNYEAEIRKVTGNTQIQISNTNRSTGFGKSVITQKVRDFVRQHYAADYALGQKLGFLGE